MTGGEVYPAANRPFEDRDAGAVVDLSLGAWEPVYAFLERVPGYDISESLNPRGRRGSQRRAVGNVSAAKEGGAWVAEVGAGVVGSVSAGVRDPKRALGETSMLAVDPDHRGGDGRDGGGTPGTPRRGAPTRGPGSPSCL